MAKRYLIKREWSLLLHIPPKLEKSGPSSLSTQALKYAVMRAEGTLEDKGELSCSAIKEKWPKIKRIVTIFADSDVNILHLEAPQLSASNLKLALPNLVEEYILSGTEENILIPGGRKNNREIVYVADKSYVKNVTESINTFWDKPVYFFTDKISLSEPSSSTIFAKMSEYKATANLSIRTAVDEVYSMSINRDQTATSLDSLTKTIMDFHQGKNVELEIPEHRFLDYQREIKDIEYNGSIFLKKYNWRKNLNIAHQKSINLSSFLSLRPSSTIKLKNWKTPLILGISLVIFNTVSLQWNWWNLQNKSSELQNSITRVFKTKYPDEKVILDPLAQMRQKLNFDGDLRLSDPNSFIHLLTALGEFKETLLSRKPENPSPRVISIEYRNKNLYIHFDPNNESILDQNKDILEELGLSVKETASKNTGIIWELSGEER